MMSWLRREVTCPWLARRHGKPYHRHLPALRREIELVADPQARRRLQFERMRDILHTAYDHSPFYREHFDAASFAPDSFRDLDDLARVPTFEKHHIISNQDHIRCRNVAAEDLFATATGGTTGNSFPFWYDRRCIALRDGMTTLANAAYDWHPGDPVAVVWNAHQDLPSGPPTLKGRLRNWASWRKLVIDATHISEEKLDRWTRDMARQRVQVVYGYAQSVVAVAEYLDATGRRVPSVRLAVTTAEPLYAADRVVLARAFACDVRDRYASRETGPMAQEDHDGRMRYYANSMLLETEGPAGEPGDILVTDFWNHAFPFIRYRIGDTALVDPTGSDATGLPVMGPLSGRVTDFLVALDGGKVSGMSFHQSYTDEVNHTCGRDAFLQLQFRQTHRDRVLARVVPGPSYRRETEEERLVRIVRELLGRDMRVDIEYPESIPRTASGKYRFTVFELDET